MGRGSEREKREQKSTTCEKFVFISSVKLDVKSEGKGKEKKKGK